MISASQASDVVALVAPGFIAIEVFRSAYPVKTRSDKSDVYLYVIYSLVSASLLSLLSHHQPASLLGFSVPSKGTPLYPLVLLAVGWLVGQGCVIYYWSRYQLSKKFRRLAWLRPDPQTTWNRVNQDLSHQWAYIFLKDGSVYLGYIRFWNFDPDSQSQDFFLDNARRVDERLDIRGQKTPEWTERYLVSTGVYISTSEVSRIELHGPSL
jgi:hypothetical protein